MRGPGADAALEARGFLGLARLAADDEMAALADLRAAAQPYLDGRRTLRAPGVGALDGVWR